MTEPIKKRARGQAQKQERRLSILQSGASLLATRDYAGISVQLIATEAGVAPGTIYLYFKTKEELFLALHQQERLSLMKEWQTKLAKLTNPDDLPKLTGGILAHRPVLMRLFVITNQILEHNISFDLAKEFKLELHRALGETGTALEQAIPWMQPGQGAGYLWHVMIYAIGLWPTCDQAPIIQEVYAQVPELQVKLPEFSAALEQAAGWFLEGMKRGV